MIIRSLWNWRRPLSRQRSATVVTCCCEAPETPRSVEESARLNKAAEQLAVNLRNLEHAGSVATVLGLEGDAAHIYFNQINLMLRPTARAYFSFSNRNRRPPKDRINALLSFLYALLLNDCRSALETVGLDPQLGFLHAVRPGRACPCL